MRVMLSCGEASGDLYAAALVHELRRREPLVDVFGFGGPRLEAAGARMVGEFAGLSVTGLTEAVRVVPRALGTIQTLVRAARETRPDVFVAIDFPDFNFRLMRALWRLHVPIVYYVSPQLVDHVLVIFPFEEEIYRRAGVPVTFVGHPLVDMATPERSRADLLSAAGLSPVAATVALLPGSRSNELRRIAPTLAEAIPLIRARVPGVQFLIARAPGLRDDLFAPFRGGLSGERPLSETSAPIAIVEGATDDVLAACDVAITASGTATVQCALHERPMVVVYRLSGLSYMLGKPFVKVDTYAMANLVAGERVVPELIQDDFTPARVAEEATGLLLDRERYERARRALAVVRERLGASGASGRAAEAILAVAGTHLRG